MTAARTFAAWVEPTARRLRDQRAETLRAARAFPAEAWEKPSAAEGWSNKDLLAHLAGGNDRLFQAILQLVAAGKPIDKETLSPDTNTSNADGVAARRDKTPDELIEALESEGDEAQKLLAALRPEHEQLRQDDPPFILESFLRFVGDEGHDVEHVAQLRA